MTRGGGWELRQAGDGRGRQSQNVKMRSLARIPRESENTFAGQPVLSPGVQSRTLNLLVPIGPFVHDGNPVFHAKGYHECPIRLVPRFRPCMIRT
ncbi:hypothetical protein RB10825 [Rhodopirellula baltica SH 1]|uniref:Uncharacterized protein n=1 Tax=Rhodopirellula baltica (strain DSM 10527 / NCIMB 13988 / SH1) TaxID=243090 RepID=Q7UK68_RHOBA|nr:hypothetical protein RB10825 [Rhodopirellula baltica SH 1]